MDNEIQIIHDDGAETLYAIVRDLVGNWYHGTNPEAFDDANWGDYDIALAEVHACAGGNVAVQGTFPAVAAGFYWLDVYVQAGANPAQTDWRLASILYYWDGAALSPSDSVAGFAGNVDSTGGSLTMAKAVEALVAWATGKCVYNAATGVASYYGQDGDTVIVLSPLLGGGNRDEPTIG
jgi:hypothetical protein